MTRRWPSGFKRMLLGMIILAVACVVLPVAIAAGAILVWHFHVLAAAIPIVAAVTAVTLMFTRAKLSGIGFRFGIHGNDKLYSHPCRNCTGGATTLRTDKYGSVTGWGSIPEKNRLWFPGTDHFHPPLANVRACTYCNGRGFLLLPYPPKDRT